MDTKILNQQILFVSANPAGTAAASARSSFFLNWTTEKRQGEIETKRYSRRRA